MNKGTFAAAFAAGCILTTGAEGTLADTLSVCQPAGTCDFDRIQDAIDAAVDGDDVVVEPGSYHERLFFSGTVPTGPKAITVRSTNPLDPSLTTIEWKGESGNVVTFNSGEGIDSVLEGFTITGGESDYGPPGSGIYVVDSSPTIRNCDIKENHSTVHGGGGIYLENSSATITDCTIRLNTVSSYAGGGISMGGGSSPVIENCIIEENSATSGGGIMIADSTPVIRNSTIGANTAGSGGGTYITAGSTATIEDCTIDENSSDGGAGIYVYDSTLNITRTTINENTSIGAMSFGGGIYSYLSTVSVSDSTISGNSASTGGGGALAFFGAFSIEGSEIRGNWTTYPSGTYGGGLYFLDVDDVSITNCFIHGNGSDDEGTVITTQGGGIALRGTTRSTTITNTSIVGNSATQGGGIAHSYDPTFYAATIINSILFFNTSSPIHVHSANQDPNVTWSDIEGGWPGEGNIDQDPLFVDASDSNPANWDLHLQSDSLCVNAGDPASIWPVDDIDGDARTTPEGDGLWDMGADEVSAVTITKATYNYLTDKLKVFATSPNGASADLELVGYGPMNWNAGKSQWRKTVTEGTAPLSITVCGPLDGCSTVQ